MALLLICSFVSVTVIVLRGLALRRDLVMPPVLEREIESIGPGDEDAANRLARIVYADHSAFARIIHVGLHHLNWPKAENLDAVQTRARHEIVKLESGLFILEIIVGIAPLLGLLGSGLGPRLGVFAAFGSDVNRAGSARHRQRHLGGAQHHHRRPRDRHSEPHRLQLFLQENRNHGHGDGLADRRSAGQVLLPPGAYTHDALDAKSNRILAGTRRRAERRGGGAMKFYARKRRMPQVIIVSLIDIFAILLIFVIVTTTFKRAQPSVVIKLPESKSAVAADKSEEPVVLTVSENEEIFLDTKKVTLEQLTTEVARLVETKKTPALAMSADKKISYGFLIQVLDALKKAGIKGNLSAFTEAK